MPDAALRSDATLAEWLAAHAQSVSVRRLVLDVVGGAVVAVAAIIGRPRGWAVLLGCALCFVCFGTWAAAERRLSPHAAPSAWMPAPRSESDDARVGWRILRVTAKGVGVLAAALAVFSLVFGLLGTWIS